MEIIINGETIKAEKSPKAGVWRKYMEFDQNRGSELTNEPIEYVERHAEIVALVFNDPRVTGEAIIDNYTIDEVIEKYTECLEYLIQLVVIGAKKIPNADAQTDEN